MVRLARALSLEGYALSAFIPPQVAHEKLEEANAIARKAKDIDPRNARAYIPIGIHSLAQRDVADAIRWFETGSALDPNSAVLQLLLSTAMNFSGEQEVAIAYAEQGLRLDPRGPQVAVAMINMGIANFYLGRVDASIDWFLQGRAANPKLPIVYSGLAVAYARKGADVNARAAVATLLALAPQYAITRSLESPLASSPEAYRRQFNNVYLPAARRAGLPGA